MTRILKKYWPILLILVAAFFTRVYKLEELYYFTYDESVFAFVGRRFWLWQHIPLIGGVSPFGFHVAPYFYWFFGLTLGIGQLNPLIWGYIAAIIGTLTTFAIYFFGKEIDSKKIGFLAAVLWAFSLFSNLYDRHFWGLTFGPLFSILVIFCLYKIIKGSEKFVYVLGVVLGLIIHADLSFYVFLLMAIVSWIIFRLPVKKSTFFALGLILFSFLPLVVFDIRHNFANTRPVIQFWAQGRNNPGFETQKFIDNSLLFPRTFSRLIYTFGDNEVSKQYSYCPAFVKEKFDAIPWYLVLISSITLVSFIVWSLIRTDKETGWRLIGLLVVLYFLGIQTYGTIFRADIFEHYITGTFALFALILAKILSYFPNKIIFIALALFIATNLNKVLNAKNDLGLTNKKQAIEYTMSQVGDNPFSLDSLSTCWKLSGYRYLFTVFGREPVKSYVDPNFSYLYGKTPVADKHPATVVTFVAHDFVPENEEFYQRYALLKSREVKSSLFGRIEVIIMDNSSGWFD